MPVGNHTVSVRTILTVDGVTLPERTGSLTPETRINPKDNIPYTNGSDLDALADVTCTIADITVLYLYSKDVDVDIKFTVSGGAATPHTERVLAGTPFIWTSLDGTANPLTVHGTTVTAVEVTNLGTAGGVANLVTTAINVDISC